MDDKADVVLVIAHPKFGGGNDSLYLILIKALKFLFLIIDASVIRNGIDTMIAKKFTKSPTITSSSTINDSSAWQLVYIVENLVSLVLGVNNLKMNLISREIANKRIKILAHLVTKIFNDTLRSSSRGCKDMSVRERVIVNHLAQLRVLKTEVMSPV